MIFAGEVISLDPAVIQPGQEIKLLTKWKVSTSSWWEANLGWFAEIEISLGGMSGKKRSAMFYTPTREFSHLIDVGPDTMPSHDLTGDISITCYKGGFSSYSEVVFFEPIRIRIPSGSGGNGQEEVVEKKLPIIPIAIVAALGIVAIAAKTK